MAEPQTTLALARMLALHPQFHDLLLGVSERGLTEGIGGSDGLVGVRIRGRLVVLTLEQPFTMQSVPEQPHSFIIATVVMMPRCQRESWHMGDIQIATTTLVAKP